MNDESIEDILARARDRMVKAVAATQGELTGIRTGRASVALVEHIVVDYYDSKMGVNQLATISVPEPQLVVIHPWDKGSVPAIEKAIMQSDLGLTPSNDGTVIRVPFPPLNEERRHEMVKLAKKIVEEGRVAIRNIRRDANEHLKAGEKDHRFSEDDSRHQQGEVQKATDKYIGDIDEVLKHKESEIMEV